MKAHGEIPELRQRYRYLVTVVVVSFLILIGRLWQLQVVRGDQYRQQTEENLVHSQRIKAVRGGILDRKGRAMVVNRPSFDVYADPRRVDQVVLQSLVRELSLEPAREARIARQLEKARKSKHGRRILVLRDISRDELARIETKRQQFKGVTVRAAAHRNYLHGNLAAHVLGYLNEINAEELEDDETGAFRSGDLKGRFGIERMYDTQLRGVHGVDRYIVDARGRRKRASQIPPSVKLPVRTEPIPGRNLTLTIDLELQRLVERGLRRYRSGAAVVIEVETGRILASASRPSFDPNLLSGRLTIAESRRLHGDPHRPLLDKVYREHYFPGSVYKVVSTIAGLQAGLIDWEESVKCKGWHHFGRRTFRCSHAHGKTALHDAIVESCNVYFYTMAERVGMDRIAKAARHLGLGAVTGLGLNGEVPGFIPTKGWYAERKRPFRIGYTLNASIGQGNVKTTPIQIAALYAALANGGRLLMPQIVERVSSAKGEVLEQFKPRVRRQLDVTPDALARIRSALYGVVQDRDGTAYDARLSDVLVSGKTGTAQVAKRGRGKRDQYWLKDHSWFASYAPSDKPEIAVVVIVEHGGAGAEVAAPVAMKIIRGYFKYVKGQVEPGKPATKVGLR